MSPRELEVLRLMALEGLQTVGIAQRLQLSASTVRQHCVNAYRKLGVTHAVQALVVCFNAGWIDPGARDDQGALEQAKRRTDAALVAPKQPRRSVPSRDWIDRLIATMGQRCEVAGLRPAAAARLGPAAALARPYRPDLTRNVA